MKYSVRAFNGGTFWVPGPEVYWMEAWNQREEMNTLIYLVQGGGPEHPHQHRPSAGSHRHQPGVAQFLRIPRGADRALRSATAAEHSALPGSYSR